MGLIDFILNLAGLLLWLNWRATRADPLGKPAPATLIGTLRRAVPAKPRRWHLPAALGGLLALRALFYWQVGSATNWAGRLDLGVTVLSFPSNLGGPFLSFLRIQLFSFCSFALTLAVFYLWLILLSMLAGPEPIHGLVRMQLGRVDRWPRWIKCPLPLAVVALLWWLASWLLTWSRTIPHPPTAARHLGEALVIAADSYPAWKYLIAALLTLHLLNSYIYFGKHPFWNYVTTTARTLLTPLNRIPLRAGKADFAPVVGIVLVFLIGDCIQNGIKLFPRADAYGHALRPFIDIPGLVDFYRWLTL